jgi:probable HAF family extracellular repeat protein
MLALGFLSLSGQAQMPTTRASRFGRSTKARATAFAPSPAKAPAVAGQSVLNLTFGLIDFPRSPDSTAQGLNSRGDIVGLYGPNLPAYEGTEQSYVLEGNNFQELVYPGASYTLGLGINKSRKIVGWYSGSDGNAHAFLRKNKEYTTIDYPGSDNTIASSINDAGEIVGIYYPNTGVAVHGFILKKGVYTTIDPDGSIFTEPLGINSSGTLVGFFAGSDQVSHGFVFQNGQFTTVDYPGASNTQLTGINDQGQMVGGYGDDVIIGDEDWPTPNAFFLEQGNFTAIHPPFGDIQVTWTDTLNGNQFVGTYADSLGNIYGYLATISQ